MAGLLNVRALLPKSAKQLSIEAKRRESLAKANAVRLANTKKRRKQKELGKIICNQELMNRIFAAGIKAGRF